MSNCGQGVCGGGGGFGIGGFGGGSFGGIVDLILVLIVLEFMCCCVFNRNNQIGPGGCC